MKYKIKITMGGILFSELPKEKQEKIKEIATNAQREIVSKRVNNMIQKGRPESEIKAYLGL